jgi:hypothetical protein
MALFNQISGRANTNRRTATAGTLIQQLIRPFRGAFTVVTGLRYSCTTTLHTGRFHMEIGRARLAAAAAAGATTLTLTAQPTGQRVIAANDYIVVEYLEPTLAADGPLATAAAEQVGWQCIKVTSVAGLVLTVPTTDYLGVTTRAMPGPGPTTGGTPIQSKGARVWLMSLSTDQIPGYGDTEPTLSLGPVTATTEYPTGTGAGETGIAGSLLRNSPLLFESNNVTNAGVLEFITAVGFLPAAASPRQDND